MKVRVRSLCLVLALFAKSCLSAETNSTIETPPIVIQGKREKPSLKVDGDVPGNILLPDSHQGLKEKINESPAVWRSRSGTDDGGMLVLRGQPPIQNRYFLEGIPLGDPQYFGNDLGFLPLSQLGKAHLFPGAIPTELLSDGLGGAIQFRFRSLKAPRNFGLSAGTMGTFSGSGSLHSGGAELLLEGRASKQSFVFFDDNGTPFNTADDSVKSRENNASKRILLLPSYDFGTQKFAFKIFSLVSFGHRQIPGPITQENSGELKDRFALVALHGKSAKQWDGSLYTKLKSDDLRMETYGVAPPKSSRGFGLGLRSNWKKPLDLETPVDFHLALGGDRDTYETSDFGNSSRLNLAVSGGTRIGKGTEVVPGLLLSYEQLGHDQTTDPARVSFSPRLSAAWEFSEAFTFRGMGGSFFRNPSLFERYGSPSGLSANPDLKSERALKGELGADYRKGSFGVSYTFAVSSMREMIVLIQNSPNSRISTNVGKSILFWNEAAAEWRLGSLTLTSSLAWIHSRNQSPIDYQEGKALPSLPDSRAQVALKYVAIPKGFWARTSLERFGGVYWDFANQKRMDPRWLWDVSVGWDTKVGDFSLWIEDVLDGYSAPSSFFGTDFRFQDNTTGYPGYPAPGRRISISWKKYI